MLSSLIKKLPSRKRKSEVLESSQERESPAPKAPVSTTESPSRRIASTPGSPSRKPKSKSAPRTPKTPRDPPAPVEPEPPEKVALSALRGVVQSFPPKSFHASLLSRLDEAKPDQVKALTDLLEGLTPPSKLHCARCHRDYLEEENYERSCVMDHDDNSTAVRHGETIWGCCGHVAEGEETPAGWCYEGRHTDDRTKARYRDDADDEDDGLQSCQERKCHKRHKAPISNEVHVVITRRKGERLPPSKKRRHTQAKLQKDLELSAEVGQALLERHEAYVRRHDKMVSDYERDQVKAHERLTAFESSNKTLVSKLAELARENTQLQKRLAQADLNLEVSDASNRTLLKELQDSRTAMARITAQHARSTGWETRLAAAKQEREDLIQEREAESVRSRNSEAKAQALESKCSELQTQIARLKNDLDAARASRAEVSEILMQDARARLEGLQNSLGLAGGENPEVTRILESLVADNEAIKRDNAELQNLLTETREDLRLVREELSEYQAGPSNTFQRGMTPDTVGSSPKVTPLSLKINTHARRRSSGKSGSSWVPPAAALVNTNRHRSHDSWATINSLQSPFTRTTPSPMFPSNLGHGYPWKRSAEVASQKRSRSTDATSPRHTAFEESDATGPSAISPSPSPLSFEPREETSWATEATNLSPEKPRTRPKTLMLLSRSRGVQTDGTGSESDAAGALLQPHFPRQKIISRNSSNLFLASRSKATSISDAVSTSVTTPFHRSTASESSSLADFGLNSPDQKGASVDLPAPLPALIDRVTVLHSRISQADVRTLNNRLKRQHIVGGDVGHLSASTLKAITLEVKDIRGHFKPALDAAIAAEEGNGVTIEPISTLSRKDLRALLKLVKDLLTELVQLRSTVNDVTLDPPSAVRLREEALSDVLPGQSAGGAGDPEADRGRTKLLKPQTAIGWIAAPIQKLFSAPGITPSSTPSPEGGSTNVSHAPSRTSKTPRPAPKLAPAVSASTTTVNVEFASTGFRRATVAEGTDLLGVGPASTNVTGSSTPAPSLGRSASTKLGLHGSASNADLRSKDLFGIFAGAPQPPKTEESWVVLPNKDKRVSSLSSLGSVPSSVPSNSFFRPRPLQASTLDGPGFAAQRRPGGTATMFNPNRLSRIVDAIIDDSSSIAPSDPDQTLRSRRLSDSSIHSNFVIQSPVKRLLTPAAVALSAPPVDTITPSSTEVGSSVDKDSVLKALSRKVQSFNYFGAPVARSPTFDKGESAVASTNSPPVSTPKADSSPATPLTTSPPRAIPSQNRHPRADRSASRGAQRDGSPGGRMLNLISGGMHSVASWMNPEDAT
ncbi:hypothetical protein FRB99_007771, partial [Tulasnella sp. 403]